MNTNISILKTLDGVHPNNLLFGNILAEVRIRQRPHGCGEAEFKDALNGLLRGKYVESEEDELTHDFYYKITEAGMAYLKGR